MILKDQTKTLVDLRSKINVVSTAFAFQIGLKIWQTNIGVQNLDNTILKIYGMIVFTNSMSNKNAKETFFKRTFFWLILR